MIKSFVTLKKKANLTQEEFLRYWKVEHGPLVSKVIPDLKRYVQNHPIKLTGGELNIDGITETWWENIESLQNYLSWRKTEEAKVLIEDENKFVDKSSVDRFIAEEHVIMKGYF